MAGVRHSFTSTNTDGSDATKVQKAAWNSDHVVDDGALTAAKTAFAATQRVHGRNTAGAGNGEEVTASQILDWISASNGAILGRFGGSWGAIANVTNDNGDLVLADNATPVAPAAGTKIFGQSLGGRSMPAFIAPAGDKAFLQPMLARRSRMELAPVMASNSYSVIGWAATNVGTITVRVPSSTNFYTATTRATLVSAATGTSVASIRNALGGKFWRGNAAGLGGFFVVWRFGVGDASLNAAARMFAGIGSTAAPTDVDPSTLTNTIGVGCNSGDTVLQLYASGSAAQARTSLGANFPVNTISTDVYELILFCAPNAATVSYQVTRLNTGDTTSGVISAAANLPSTTTFMTQRAYRSEGGTATAVGLDIMSFYAETDN